MQLGHDAGVDRRAGREIGDRRETDAARVAGGGEERAGSHRIGSLAEVSGRSTGDPRRHHARRRDARAGGGEGDQAGPIDGQGEGAPHPAIAERVLPYVEAEILDGERRHRSEIRAQGAVIRNPCGIRVVDGGVVDRAGRECVHRTRAAERREQVDRADRGAAGPISCVRTQGELGRRRRRQDIPAAADRAVDRPLRGDDAERRAGDDRGEFGGRLDEGDHHIPAARLQADRRRIRARSVEVRVGADDVIQEGRQR